MINDLRVSIRHNYGTRAVYPACETSQKLADLLGTKTFTPSAIRQLQGIGYNFIAEQVTI